VDLNGFTAGGRPEIFGFRPAPLQMSYLGWPGSTGAAYIDFNLMDPVVQPVDDTACSSAGDGRYKPALCLRCTHKTFVIK
jgi:predicted O-linked N-acetylglucosamine transferase (SPINDLY family)